MDHLYLRKRKIDTYISETVIYNASFHFIFQIWSFEFPNRMGKFRKRHLYLRLYHFKTRSSVYISEYPTYIWDHDRLNTEYGSKVISISDTSIYISDSEIILQTWSFGFQTCTFIFKILMLFQKGALIFQNASSQFQMASFILQKHSFNFRISDFYSRLGHMDLKIALSEIRLFPMQVSENCWNCLRP